jgi:diguanylate cyclase (GGDEF)-like protein
LFWGILQLFLAVITWLMASAKASKALSQEIIRYQAYHDALTSLPNRKLFEDRLTMALAQAKRNKDLLAVMLFDLDSFKKVNDTLGHAQGDVLLQMVAGRVGNCLRESDTLARLGGDEFTILLPQINSIEDAMVVASRIHDAFQTPFELGHSHVKTTTSLGIAIYPQDGEDIESLMKHADTAMYRVKEQGRNNFQIFSSMTTTSPSM